ncbi:hypothetical protein [Bacillus nitroreducens]
MQKLLVYFLYVIFFVIYFSIAGFLYNAFIPFKIYTGVLVSFIMVILVPASILSGNKFISYIKISPDQNDKK